MSDPKDKSKRGKSDTRPQYANVVKIRTALGLAVAVVVLEGKPYPLHLTGAVPVPSKSFVKFGGPFKRNLPAAESDDAFGTYTITASGALSGLLDRPAE